MSAEKRISRYVLLFIMSVLTLIGKSQTISPVFFGQNAWMPDTIGNAAACPNPPCILYGKLHKNWNNIQFSNSAIVRFGGIAPDRNKPTNYQYIKMIDSIRAKGMEPIMQVPYHAGEYTAQQAASIVQYINITKGKNIKYWIIGNEPDLDYGYTTSAQVASYFRPFASAMKAVDPSIKTIGPETAWYDQPIINGLTNPGGPDDITGKDANGRFYCDIISFHYYPFNGTQTRAQVMTKLTNAGGLNDNLSLLNARLANCNAFHNRTGSDVLRSAITEANVNYQNSTTDNLNGVGANSFIGGQFVAEMLSVAMKNNVNFVNIWSVIEGNTTALNIGYIDPPTSKKKPLFWHYKLLAENFTGTYASGTSNNANVKSFGSYTAGKIEVFIMNEDLTNNLSYTVRLNTAAVTGTSSVKININSNVASQYNSTIGNQTSVLLTFDPSGQLIKKCTYSLANHAALNLPPSCESISVLPVSLKFFNAQISGEKTVRLSWQTASEKNNSYFVIQRSKDALEFEDLVMVPGAGTSHTENSYSFTDEEALPGTSYYRLKQSDFDGTFTYSDLMFVTFSDKENTPLVFPNPGDGSLLNVRFYDAVENMPVINLFDYNGKPIPVRTVRGNNSEFSVYPETPPAKGLYFLKIKNGKTFFTEKWLVN